MKQNKMNCTELSHACGISKSMISLYLSGKGLPRMENAQKLADALRVDVVSLVGSELYAKKTATRFKKTSLPVLFEIDD